MQDGDTIAIGGFIQEKQDRRLQRHSPAGPHSAIGVACSGRRATATARTELIIFLTPRVIYDTNQIQDATDEIKSNLKHLQKDMKND